MIISYIMHYYFGYGWCLMSRSIICTMQVILFPYMSFSYMSPTTLSAGPLERWTTTLLWKWKQTRPTKRPVSSTRDRPLNRWEIGCRHWGNWCCFHSMRECFCPWLTVYQFPMKMWLMMLQTTGMKRQVKSTSPSKDRAVVDTIPELNELLT